MKIGKCTNSHQLFTYLFIFSFIHSLENHLCQHTTGIVPITQAVGLELAICLIFIPSFYCASSSQMIRYIVGAGDPMVKYIFPCFFCWKGVTCSGKECAESSSRKSEILQAVRQIVVLTPIQVGVHSDTHPIDTLSVLVPTKYWIEGMQCNQWTINWLVKLHAVLSYQGHSFGLSASSLEMKQCQ